jgi:hypothetical protein
MMGFLFSTSATWLIWRTACALVHRVDEGDANQPRLALELGQMAVPKVSAVMPVPSEMTKTYGYAWCAQ